MSVSVSVGTSTAATIVTANPNRISLIISNIGVSSAFLSELSTVTSANGIVLTASGTWTEDGGSRSMWLGEYYAIAGSAGTTVTYWQRTRGNA